MSEFDVWTKPELIEYVRTLQQENQALERLLMQRETDLAIVHSIIERVYFLISEAQSELEREMEEPS